jgi:hypothetical protein
MLPSGGKRIEEMTLIWIARSVKKSKGETCSPAHATPRMHGKKNMLGFGSIVNEMDDALSGWLRDVTG